MGGLFPQTPASRIGAFVFVGIVVLFFGWIALRINLPQERPAAEPLPAAMRARLVGLPLNANVLVYLGMKEIRASDFWTTFVPDSVKSQPIFADTTSLGRFAKATRYNFVLDTDTAFYAEVNRVGLENRSLGVLIGRFDETRVKAFLASSTDSLRAGDRMAYQIEPRLWMSMVSPTEMVMTSHADVAATYLQPQTDFFTADSVMQPLIDRAQFKSQFWVALGSARWAFGALQGLTTSTQNLSSTGNIRRIEQLALSAKLTDGVEGQTEWIYENRTSAFFAGGLIGIALWVSRNFSGRQTEAQKKLLGAIELTQNLESLMFRASISKSLLDELRQPKP